jgi:hypothetical protein
VRLEEHGGHGGGDLAGRQEEEAWGTGRGAGREPEEEDACWGLEEMSAGI